MRMFKKQRQSALLSVLSGPPHCTWASSRDSDSFNSSNSLVGCANLFSGDLKTSDSKEDRKQS